MTTANGPTPEMLQQRVKQKGKAQQVVSRDDLIRAIQKMQLPAHQPPTDGAQVQPPPSVWGTRG